MEKEEKILDVNNTEITEQEGQNEEVNEKLLSIVIELPDNMGSFDVIISTQSLVNEIKQYIWDSPEAHFYTCFSLYSNGKKLNEMSKIENDNVVIKIVKEKYSERDVRFHLVKMLEILKGYKNSNSFGLLPSQTYFTSILNETKEKESISENENESENKNNNKENPNKNSNNKKGSKKGKKVKKNKNEQVLKDENEENYEEILNDITNQNPKISEFLPKNFKNSNIDCLTYLTLSSWNPVSYERKMKGDILYLKVMTLEKEIYQITASTSGFYCNRSTDEIFNPLIVHDEKVYDTLSAFLSSKSPLYKKNIEKHLNNIKNMYIYEYSPIYPEVYPWLVKSSTLKKSQNSLDIYLNNLNTIETYGVRDWNEEFRTVKNMPKNEPQELILRDQSYNRVYTDFIDAAVHGAVSAVNGNMISLNQSKSESENKINIYIHNGIFYTCGYDEYESFEKLGGSEAAHVAIGKDIAGINILNNADLDEISSLGTVVVDYMGRRVVAQIVIPEIIHKAKEGSIVYGSTDHGKTILNHENVHKKLGEASKALHLEEHRLLDETGKEHSLYTSMDIKAILGNNDEIYLLDLYRLTPIDIEFLDEVEKDIENPYPHKLTLIRPELISLYIQHKVTEYLKTLNDNAPKNEDGSTNVTEEELLKQRISQEEIIEKTDIRFNTDCFIYKTKKDDQEGQTQEENVRLLSKFITSAVLPGFILDLTQNKCTPVDSEALTKTMHQRGINMRYLGKIAKLIEISGETKLQYYNKIIINEMILRVAKRILRKLLKELSIDSVSQCISHFLNCLYMQKYSLKTKSNDNSSYTKLTSESLWDTIRKEINVRFRYELVENYLMDRKIPILKALCKKVGIQIEMRDYDFFNTEKIFKSSDILNIYPIVKAPELKIKYAQYAQDSASSFLAKGNIQVGLDLFNEAQMLYEQVYGPLHPSIATCCREMALIYSIQQDEHNKILARDTQQKAIIILERTLGVDDSETIMQYFNLAYYEYNLKNISNALQYVKHALYHWNLLKQNELHPNDLNIMKSIGSMLRNIGKFDLSLFFYKAVLEANKLYYGKKHLMTGLSYHQVTQAHCLINDFKSALSSENNAQKIFLEELGENDERTIASQNLYNQLKNRTSESNTEEILNKNDIGNLPIEDIMKYISGEVSYKSVTKLAKNKNKKSN